MTFISTVGPIRDISLARLVQFCTVSVRPPWGVTRLLAVRALRSHQSLFAPRTDRCFDLRHRAIAGLPVDEKVKITKEFVVDFDTQNPLEVLRDLAKQRTNTIPHIFPSALVKQIDSILKYEKTARANGHNNYPFWMPNSR